MSLQPISWDDLERRSASEAAATLVDRLALDPSAVSDGLLDRWLAADERNREAWISARDAWDAYDGWNTDARLARMRDEAVRASFRRRHHWRPAAIAAALAIVCIGGFELMRSTDAPTPTPETAARPNWITTPGGVRRAVRLPDGTKVLLEGGSAVELAFDGRVRLLRLSTGKATVDVASEQSRPFRLEVGGRSISDLGTVFSAEWSGASLRVELFRGKVAIAAARGSEATRHGEVVLAPGDVFVSSAAGERVLRRTQADTTATSRGRLHFREEALGDVVASVNAGSPVQVAVDPRLRGLRISGSFHPADGSRFAHAVAELYPIEVHDRADGRLMLVPKENR